MNARKKIQEEDVSHRLKRTNSFFESTRANLATRRSFSGTRTTGSFLLVYMQEKQKL
jgi:hypothetical protein